MTALRIALPSGCTWRVCSTESWNRRRVWWWKQQLRSIPFSSTGSSSSQVRRLLFTVSSSSSSTSCAARGVELRSIAGRCYATTGFQGLSPALSSSSSSSAAECRQQQQEARGIGSISAAVISRLQRREEGHSILSVPNAHAHRGAELQAISSRSEECRLLEDANDTKLKKRIAEESVVETKQWFWSQILAQIKLKQWIDSKRLGMNHFLANQSRSHRDEENITRRKSIEFRQWDMQSGWNTGVSSLKQQQQPWEGLRLHIPGSKLFSKTITSSSVPIRCKAHISLAISDNACSSLVSDG